MLNGTALDVLEIDAASNRGIDEIRSLREAVKFAPSVMRMKVYIIDEAHMLTKEGANAFLKTLEEPPAHAVFILATTEPEKLPVTILSRCQRYAFRRISIPVMIERMREIATYEGIAIDEAALAAIAYRADGGLRDALTMLEQAAAFADGPITTSVIDLAFGATGRNYANTLLDAVVARDAAAALRVIEEASDAGADMVVLTRSLIANFRNLLVARIDPELLARDLAPEDAELASERAEDVPQATIVRALRVLADAATLARTGANPRLELETAILRLVLEEDSVTLSAPKAQSKGPVEKAPAKASHAAAPSHPEVQAERASKGDGPVTLSKFKAAWDAIRGKVYSERQSLRTQLGGAMPTAIEGNAVVLKLRSAFEADILKEHTKLLESAIADVVGSDLKVRFETGAPSAAAPAAESTIAEEESADELFGYANERIK
jgi:DNA polymerase III subunit gamma/tau